MPDFLEMAVSAGAIRSIHNNEYSLLADKMPVESVHIVN